MRSNFSMTWSPAGARVSPPSNEGSRLGQPSSLGTFIDNPEVSAMIDLTAAAASGYLAAGLLHKKNNWGIFWAIVSAASGMKFLHDIAR